MRRHHLILCSVLAVLALAGSGCGAEGGNDASAPASTDAASSDEPTTSGPGSSEPTSTEVDESTTTEADPGSAPTADQLMDILPTDEEIGDGYTRKEDDPSEDPADDPSATDPANEAALLEACPGAKILEDLDANDDTSDDVAATWAGASGEELEITLDPTPKAFDEETVDKVVDALADCDTITYTDEETGQEVKMDLTAERNDDHGDYGIELGFTASVPIFGIPLTIELKGLYSVVDGVGVGVSATSGFDQTSFEPVPGDYDRIPELADLMQERVQDLN